MRKINFFRLEIIIFMFCLFFQNFAIFYTANFGISALVVFLLFLTIKYHFYEKINKKFIAFLLILILFTGVSSIFNKYFDFFQIIRLLMILFIVWATFKYIKLIFEKKQKDNFLRIFLIFCLIISIYGIYEYIAASKNLPLFLNIFNNNPSYGLRGIFQKYSGWSNTNRIYTVFFEPSVYSMFLVNALAMVIAFVNTKLITKIITAVLMIINIYLTFARSGWITLLCFIIVYFGYKIVNNKKILNKMFEFLIVLIPFLILFVMVVVGLNIFTDLSSISRTYSSMYYLSNTFASFKSFFFGHGIGSITNTISSIIYNNIEIEKFAHNGYVELIYQLGWPFLMYLLLIIKKYLDNNCNKKWIAYASVFTLCSFGTMYSVESLISLVIVIVSFSALLEEKNKINIGGEK